MKTHKYFRRLYIFCLFILKLTNLLYHRILTCSSNNRQLQIKTVNQIRTKKNKFKLNKSKINP